jgi:trehalose/maltose hydrolase-like predicted phosphorylase
MISISNGWLIQELAFSPERLRHSETVFTIGNGYFGTRGAFEEAYPDEERSTFLHGVFDDVPVVFTELANAPDWLELEVILAGERFGLDQGEVLAFERRLDLKDATLRRELRWRSPKGRTTRLVFERFASLADEHLAGLRVTITPEDYAGVVEVRTGLNVEADNQGLKHWEWLDQGLGRQSAWLHCRTRATQIELGAAVQLNLAAPRHVRIQRWDVRGHPSLAAQAQAGPGESLTACKWVTYWTAREAAHPLRKARRALPALANLEWSAAHAAHCQAWQQEWERCDVAIEGDLDAQTAVRFNIFQLLAAAPRHDERVNIGAKTLSGYGYRGHAFWDTEIFMLPLFIYTRPEIARNLLSYRFHGLRGARLKARQNGYRGAQFPWESAATGEEVTPTWVPHYADRTKQIRIWTGDIEIHISADIAYAIWLYWQTSGDEAFLKERGAELILETARFWASRAEWVPEKDHYEINDIIGPDEYHDHVDDNIYTNAMARWNLRTAFSVLDWLREHAPQDLARLRRKLGLKPAELKAWQHVAEHLVIAYDPQTRLIEQFRGYFQRKDVDLAALEPRQQSVQALFGIEETCQTQVLKQPDVLMLMYLLPEEFDRQALKVNYEYYTPRTDHTFGSSLGPSIQAIMATKMKDEKAAYEHFMRAARADLFDVRGNAADGIHGASAGGLWQAVVFGFAGLHCTPSGWQTAPCLPAHWQRISFKIVDHGRLLTFDVHQVEK